MTYIVIKAQAALATGEMYFKPKPVYTNGCTYTFLPEPAISLVSQNASALHAAAVEATL